MYTDLATVKKHLLIDDSYKDDDLYILDLITAAEDAVSVNLNIRLDEVAKDNMLPSAISQAILFLIGNFYANREPVAYTSAVSVPNTFDYLISLYKDYNKVF